MANSTEPRVLLLDPDRDSQRALAESCNSGGLFLRFLSDPGKLLPACRQMQPLLLVVHAEVRSPLLTGALAQLQADALWSQLPIVVIAEDVSDAAFLAQLRQGIVEILPKPVNPKTVPLRLQALLRELPDRSGTVQGKGDSRTLANLVEHLRRTLRSGVLMFNARQPAQGRALFAKGQLKSAEHLDQVGIEALVKMVTLSSANWTFTELASAAGEGAGVVLEVDGDEPLVPIIQGKDLNEGILVPIEGADNAGELLLTDVVPDAPAATEPASILLVDDDEELCRMFGLLFRKHGYTVTTANDGLEGYAAARNQSFDVVVADLNMPRMDGWGLLRLLREDFQTREVPVAFLSCHDDYRDSLKALNAGAQAYYSKSTRLDALAVQVRGLLDPRRRFLQALEEATSDTPVTVSLGTLGPQWVVAKLCARKLTARIDADDGWAKYQVWLKNGRPVHAVALAGRHRADGERALNAFIASRSSQGTVALGEAAPATTLQLSATEQLARSAKTLNANEQSLKEGLLVNAQQIHVDGDLYAVYAQVGPRQWLEAARLICEERLAPREVIARVDASPTDVEDTLKDLLRRGVVRLTA